MVYSATVIDFCARFRDGPTGSIHMLLQALGLYGGKRKVSCIAHVVSGRWLESRGCKAADPEVCTYCKWMNCIHLQALFALYE